MFELGFVKWYNVQKRYGFIKTGAGDEIWFHYNAGQKMAFFQGSPVFDNDEPVDREPQRNERVVFSLSRNGKGPIAAPWCYYEQYKSSAYEEAQAWFAEWQLELWPFLPEVLLACGLFCPCDVFSDDFYPGLLDEVGVHEVLIGKKIDFVLVWENINFKPAPDHKSTVKVKNYSSVMLKSDTLPPGFISCENRVPELPIYRQLINGGHIGGNNYWLVKVERSGIKLHLSEEPGERYTITVMPVGSMWKALHKAQKM